MDLASRLVVVEGLPGSGKSTFSQAILLGCHHARRAVRWYSELEVDHPLACVYRPEQHATLEEYFAECGAAWQRFLEQNAATTEQTVIVDAWFLQDPVFGLLLAGVDPEHIVSGLVELWSLLPRARTSVLYLTQRDVSAAVSHFCETRGKRMQSFYVTRNDESPFAVSRKVSGLGGLSRFWTEHSEICDAVLNASALTKVVEDVSERDWESVTGSVLRAFDLEAPRYETADLQRFSGRYVLDASSGTSFEVFARGGRLYLRNFPFFWREVDKELIRCGDATFAVQSWPANVAFEPMQGTSRSLTVSELHRCGQSPWPAGSYLRV